ncbi:non-specific lethal 1 isoform X2 [Brevipalpus obovatus]|uniref:non-specific lethal 1 isoform X2 n=1 Tax=Brevipalpus obovatus TaxID=246614 RepID=UPI003D9F932B
MNGTRCLMDKSQAENLKEYTFELQRKTDFLIKRIRRIQAKQLERQTTEQLRAFVKQHHPATSAASGHRNSINCYSNSNSVSITESPGPCVVNGCTTGAPDGSNSNDSVFFNPKESERIRTIVGTLKHHLKQLERGYDSDATESSSGGESCDENEFSSNDSFYQFFHSNSNSNSSSRETVPISERPDWKWLNERSAIASRWTWLQAQVADLEFKIRQQNEMYRQLRANKGSIAFFCKVDPPSTSVNTSSSPNCPKSQPLTAKSNVNGHASFSNCPNPNPNPNTTSTSSSSASQSKASNNHNNLSEANSSTQSKTDSPNLNRSASNNNNGPNATGSNTSVSNVPPEERESSLVDNSADVSHCARTLPLKHMRKRKLIRSYVALAGASRKIARYSTVQCSCNHYPRYVSSCVLCNGRYNYIPVIDTDAMPSYERFALLDPSYHPVLSSHNDVPLGFHFSKILKKETVQKPTTNKHSHKRTNHPTDFPYKFGPDGKKLNRRKSQAIISSAKLKRKYDGTTKKRYAHASSNRSRHRGKRSSFGDSLNASGDDRTDSPSPQPLSSENLSVPIHRRRRSEQYAYDINNIVIPYSIASTTRVEKLKYKEIDTPKWRFIEFNDASGKENDEETDEDISDETFLIRHSKCEEDEKKLFASYLRNPGAGPGRGRGARARLDSTVSESGNSVKNKNGGHNTVNANESTQNIDISSQDSIVTAPINILNDLAEGNGNANACSSSMGIADGKSMPIITSNDQSGEPQPSPLVHDVVTTHGKPAKTTERHRTSSSSKREDSVEEENYVEVTPYEKRTFPISDVDYEEMLRV